MRTFFAAGEMWMKIWVSHKKYQAVIQAVYIKLNCGKNEVQHPMTWAFVPFSLSIYNSISETHAVELRLREVNDARRRTWHSELEFEMWVDMQGRTKGQVERKNGCWTKSRVTELWGIKGVEKFANKMSRFKETSYDWFVLNCSVEYQLHFPYK